MLCALPKSCNEVTADARAWQVRKLEDEIDRLKAERSRAVQDAVRKVRLQAESAAKEALGKQRAALKVRQWAGCAPRCHASIGAAGRGVSRTSCKW